MVRFQRTDHLSTNWSFHAATGPPYSVACRRRESSATHNLSNGIAPQRGVTNDVVVKLPDHAMDRAICTNVYSVLVRTTAYTQPTRTDQLVAYPLTGVFTQPLALLTA